MFFCQPEDLINTFHGLNHMSEKVLPASNIIERKADELV
jgi:hypothetical protein